MFGTFFIITWIIGMCVIVYSILNAPEYDEHERPINKNKID